MSGKILNLVFVWAEDGMKLKVDVPVVFEGEDACPGVQKGNSLDLIFLEFDVESESESDIDCMPGGGVLLLEIDFTIVWKKKCCFPIAQ